MTLPRDQIIKKIKEKGLKLTPQRITILEAIYKLDGHPTADKIVELIRDTHPSIATGTVYKVLDALVENQLVKKVKTDKDIMRYDGMMDKHHHIYCSESDKIIDYIDRDLDELLEIFFEKKSISNFKISDVRLQIIGEFMKDNKA
ncbi:MAG: transcriptional repressor [Bacteroidales bacterium]|nr:transcriptional repressor [Bacteroidales bacterium]